jgi:DNA-directed RNA polymerase sigma subunit (sigma70/sigma32)
MGVTGEAVRQLLVKAHARLRAAVSDERAA